MRRVILLLAAVAAVIILAVLLSNYEKDTVRDRGHQHRQALPKEAPPAGDVFSTHLPLVAIETGGREVPGMERDGSTVLASIRLRAREGAYNLLSDRPLLESKAQIRYRGNSSLHFDKKSYLLKLVNEDGSPNQQELLGMPREEEWILNGPFLDKSLLRNYMLMNIAGEIMEYAPRVRYCELFVDGEYQGVYLLMESVSRATGRVELNKPAKGRAETSYIVRLDRGSSRHVELDHFSHYTMFSESVLNVVYPPGHRLTGPQKEFIERDISQFEKALYSLDYNDPALGYERYINVGTFVDYMIINEFFQNYDAGRYSTYLYKPVGGKLSIGPVWDFNNAMDNYIENAYDGTDFGMQYGAWYFMLLKDERFVDRVIRRYRELRKTVLSDGYLQSYVEETVAYLGGAADRNFQKWGYTFEPGYGLLQPLERNPGSYEQAVSQVRGFLRRRGEWLDENIELLRQFSHPSKVKKYGH